MTKMFKISLPDGSVREMEAGATPADVAAAIGPGLAKAAMAARVDGEVRDMGRPFEGDAELALITSKDEEDALELVRHDYAHVLAEAVQALWPGTQITFGPATDDGFYYDVMAPADREPFGLEDLPAIEEKMREIIKADKPLIREVWSREDLISRWEALGETFKAEWAKDLPEFEDLTVYWSGDPNGPDGENAWLDMCRGPHLASTGKLDPQAFKLMRTAGAYWRGDQNNAQLTRIYGTGWLNKKQLNAHLHRLEEAAKRDHRKLGRELDLFHFEDFAPGAVFWHPHGWQMFQGLLTYMRRRQEKAGYVEVNTPDVMDRSLWETSGHWFNYGEHMFTTQTED
ncbi:MAG: threonine--tRNA ligase, partial [Pseudomonadota bacterium]